MGKVITVIMALVLMLSLVACSETNTVTISTAGGKQEQLKPSEYKKEMGEYFKAFASTMDYINSHRADYGGSDFSKHLEDDATKMYLIAETLAKVTPPDQYKEQHKLAITMFDSMAKGMDAYAKYSKTNDSAYRDKAAEELGKSDMAKSQLQDFIKTMESGM